MQSMKKNDGLSIQGGSNEHGVTGSMTVTAGEKCKIIGWQDGGFRNFGHHLRNEMGGVWAYPVKIADRFWLRVNGAVAEVTEYETMPNATVFRGKAGDVQVSRFQFCPDHYRGAIVEYTLCVQHDTIAELSFIVRFDIQPTWFSAESGIGNAADYGWYENGFVLAKDREHEWYAGFCGDMPFAREQVQLTEAHLSPEEMIGSGVTGAVHTTLALRAGKPETLRFYLAASEESAEELCETLASMRKERVDLWERKNARTHWIQHHSELKTSSPDFDQVFEWIKYNADWLVSDGGNYGRGLTAGLPEYPWWFGCDNAYSTQGLNAIGDFETSRDTLKLLCEYSEQVNGNGRIVHEITNNGQCPNPGNSQETGHYITAVYHYWRWTGDTGFVAEVYPYCEKGIRWLLTEMDPDGDLLPSGYGIIEIRGLNAELIDTAVYTCQALFCMAEMAEALGCDGSEYRQTGEKLKEVISNRLWMEEEKLFADAVGKPAEVLNSIDILTQDHDNLSAEYREYLEKLREKLRSMPQNEDAPVLVNKNWVICTPMEAGIADREKAETALAAMRTPEFIGEYGVYLAGFMHQHTMTISTGAQAVAEGRYGFCTESLALLERMAKTYSMVLPGSISEMSPNYGCFVQAWTLYAAAVPVVECFAGFRPAIQKGELVLAPCVPDQWNEMELLGVRVGDGLVDFRFHRESGREVYRISSNGSFSIRFAPCHSGSKILVNGCEADGEIRFARGENVVEVIL